MKKYRKKSIVIKAFQYGIDYRPDWFTNKVNTNNIITFNEEKEAYCQIHTLEGIMTANYGDFIIEGIKGEIYPCKEDIFRETYDCANGDSQLEISPEEDPEVVLYRLLQFCKDKAVKIRIAEGYLLVDEVNK